MVWPRSARHSRPSMVKRISVIEVLLALGRAPGRGAAVLDGLGQVEEGYEVLAFPDHGRVELGEALHRRQDGIGRGLAEAAAARALDQVAPLLEIAEIAVRAQAGRDLLERLLDQDVAGAAGGAPAAGLVDEELHEVLDDLEEIALGAEDDDRAAGGQVAETDLAAEPVGGDACAGGPSDLDGLGPAAARHLEELGDGQAVLDLVDARPAAVPADAQELGPGGLGRAQG